MSDQGLWFKLWCSADDDPDLANLSLENFARWCKLGMYVKKHGTNGVLKVTSPAIALQHKFHVTTFDQVQVLLNEMPHVKSEYSDVTGVTVAIVTYENWQRFQGDMSRDRVRKFRSNVTAKRRGEEKRGEEKRKEEKYKPLSSPLAPDCEKFTPSQFVDLWNSNARKLGLPECAVLNQKRKEKITLRIRERPEKKFWELLFREIEHRPFLMGNGDRGWKANIDWITANEVNYLKIAEGQYQNGGRKETPAERTKRNLDIAFGEDNQEMAADF